MENFLVCHPNIGGVFTKTVATEKHGSELDSKLSKNHMAFQ